MNVKSAAGLLACIWLPTHAAQLPTDTINTASRVVIKYNELQQVVSACKYQDIDLPGLKRDIDTQMQAKTGMSTDTFSKDVLNANGDLDTLLAETKALGCPSELTGGAFYMLETSLRRALEKLTALPSVSAVATKPAKRRVQQVTSNAPNYPEAFEQAHSVVIAELIPTTSIPKRYVDTFVAANSRAEYVYFLAKGWKGTAPRYVIASDYGSSGLKRKPSAADLTGQYLFFVNEQNQIFHSAPVAEVQAYLKTLGEPDWFWAGGDLIRNKK